jgi:hypothetical protein
MPPVGDLPDRTHTAELLALKEVQHARRLIDKALAAWWAAETFDHVHDAAETLQRAAWRLRTDDAA